MAFALRNIQPWAEARYTGSRYGGAGNYSAGAFFCYTAAEHNKPYRNTYKTITNTDISFHIYASLNVIKANIPGMEAKYYYGGFYI